MMEVDSGAAPGQDLSSSLFTVKDEPLDFDLIGKVDGNDLELDLLMNGDNGTGKPSVEKKVTPVTTKKTANSSVTTGVGSVPQIGSSNSAFQPYKQQSLTILTNLQRGNVKTTNKETGPESLTFHEKAAKNTLTDNDIVDGLVNAKDTNGYTPLMWAAFHGRLHIVQKLIEKGATLDCFGPDGETALMFAACNGHSDVLSYLIEKGVEVEAEDDAGNTALMFAAYGNHVDCVNKLLRSGASMSRPNGIGDTPFEIAINKGHIAAQYAMEDFLKDQLEMSLLSKVKKPCSSKGGSTSPLTNGHGFVIATSNGKVETNGTSNGTTVSNSNSNNSK